MLHRSDDMPAALEVRALYSIAALARAANVNTYKLRRLLHANRIQFVRSGRAVFVPLSEIRSKIPSLWESLQAAETVRAAARRKAQRNRPPESGRQLGR